MDDHIPSPFKTQAQLEVEMMMKERSLVIAMDEESLKQHLEALSVDGTVANHFKTTLGLQLSLAASNPLLEGEQEAGSVPILIQEETDSEPSEELQDLLKLKENQI